MSAAPKPFQILHEIAQSSLANAYGLPQQDEAIELWSGIGFLVGSTHYVAEMGTVSEILHLPKYTAVPGVKTWMRGVANVRGRLLPVMDLARFFELGQSTAKNRDKRVLVIEQGETLSGLIVDGVLGMQYFSKDSFEPESKTTLASTVKPFINGAYSKAEVEWNVFDTAALMADDNFLDVALS